MQLAFDFYLHRANDWTGDDWETPSAVAQSIAKLVCPETEDVLEPAAGTGQISQFLPAARTTNLEPDPIRFEVGRQRVPGLWHCTTIEDFAKSTDRRFDVIVTNPPFSKIQLFIETGLSLLKPVRQSWDARLLYLLPLDWYSLKSVRKWWGKTDVRIKRVYAIPGRVSYLRNGVPVTGRRRADGVFEIVPGRIGTSAIKYLEVK